VAVNFEHDSASGTDTSRFLAAGAARSIWVRTRIGMLAEAMPRIEKELAASENAILESNSILEFLRPDLYLTVLDPAVADFKDSARRFLPLADAILLLSPGVPSSGVDPNGLVAEVPQFPIAAPAYMSDALVEFVRQRVSSAAMR
jgi:hypothetical protein